MTTESDDLRQTVASLNLTVGDLRVAVAELKTTLNGYAERDREERAAAAKIEERVGSLEKWRARVQGQIALAFFLIGCLATILGARIAHLF